jgi:plasmid stabilization system protein ParE
LGFKVIITGPALADIREIAKFISEEHQSLTVAAKWTDGLQAEIDKLSEYADKFNPIPEAPIRGIKYRSFQYHSHRVIYHLDERNRTVYVHRIFHGARRPLRPRDL